MFVKAATVKLFRALTDLIPKVSSFNLNLDAPVFRLLHGGVLLVSELL